MTSETRVELSLTCLLCDNTYFRPKVLPCCEKTYCYICLQKLQNEKKGCPDCDKSFDVNKLVQNPLIEEVIRRFKPAVISYQRYDEYQRYPHLQTAVVRREMRQTLLKCVDDEETVSFFINYQPRFGIQPIASTSKPSSPIYQWQKVALPFKRGYRCLASTPMSVIRAMMQTKFDLDASVAKISFICGGVELKDNITLRTVAFRMKSNNNTRMVIEMMILNMIKMSTSSSTTNVVEEMNERRKIEESAEKDGKKQPKEEEEEGPPVLEEETMPSLDAETPQLGQEPTPPPSSTVEEIKVESPTMNTARNVVNTPQKQNPAVVVGQVIPMQQAQQNHKTPPNFVQPQQQSSRPVSLEKKPTPVPFNQIATNQAVEWLFIRTMEGRLEPSKFLEFYYKSSTPPPTNRKLTPEEEKMYAFRRTCDQQGVVIPSISSDTQTTLYNQMRDKRIRLINEEKSNKRRSMEAAHEGAKRLKKTEVSAYVVSTPIMHKMPPPSATTSTKPPSTQRTTYILPKNVEIPKPSLLSSPIQQIDALTLSRQCSKTLGKTLAESMRRSGGSSTSTASVPSYMLHQKSSDKVEKI